MSDLFYFPIPKRNTKSKTVYDCDKCGLDKENKFFKVTYNKNKFKGLLIVTSDMSVRELKKGQMLLNENGKIIRLLCRKNKINLNKKHALIMPAMACYKKGKYTEVQKKCCQSILDNRIKNLKPRMIIACGDVAANMLLPNTAKMGITKLRGRLIPLYKYNCVVYVTYDPTNFDQRFNSHYKSIFRQDLNNALNHWNKFFHKRTEVNNLLKARAILDGATINQITDQNDLVELFENCRSNMFEEISLDYETNGLHPYDDRFHIRYVGFAVGKNAYWLHIPSMITKYGNEWFNWFKQEMQELLSNPNITKVIQNAKYEDLCSKYYFENEKIINIEDPMLATHVLDQRKGCTSLDFQNLIRFGIPVYSDKIKMFIESAKNEIVNKIDECDINDMGYYLGLDVITTWFNWKMCDAHMTKLTNENWPEVRYCYEFLKQGHDALSNVTARGIKVDTGLLDEMIEDFEETLEDTTNQIFNLKEIKEYEERL